MVVYLKIDLNSLKQSFDNEHISQLYNINYNLKFEYVYGSHNVEKGSDSQGFYSSDVWDKVANFYEIRHKLWVHVKNTYEPEDLKKGFIIYGEIYGAGIQKNYDYGLTDIKFAGFDVEVDGKYEGYPAECAHFDVLDLPQVEQLYWGHWKKQKQDKFI